MFLFLIETICCTPHLNRLVETVQMRGHNVCFHAELTKIIPNYQKKILPLILSSESCLEVSVPPALRGKNLLSETSFGMWQIQSSR